MPRISSPSFTERLLRRMAWFVVNICLLLMGCDSSSLPKTGPYALLQDPITIPFFVENEQREPLTQMTDYVYEVRQHNPVTAPDGRHLTLAEISTAAGTAEVTCTEAGTHVALALRGLIPHGVYTIWNVTFHEPGLDPERDMLNIRGIGALGPGDGLHNGFIASAQGEARLAATTPAGPLSMVGEIAGCALEDEVEYHVVGSYHMDGKTHGPDLGPEGTAIEQFGFIYKPE